MNSMRNIEDDLDGLIEIIKKCFDRNGTIIPKYEGQLLEKRRFDDSANIDELLNPKSKAHKWHLSEERSFAAILLICAWKLGYDCYEVSQLRFPNQLSNLLLAENKDFVSDITNSEQIFTSCKTETGIIIGLIDALMSIAKMIHKFDLVNSMDIKDALKDLRDCKEIRDLLSIKYLENKIHESFEKKHGKKIFV